MHKNAHAYQDLELTILLDIEPQNLINCIHLRDILHINPLPFKFSGMCTIFHKVNTIFQKMSDKLL